MLKAARHWGKDCSVINDPLGEPGRTLLFVHLPSTRVSVDGNMEGDLFTGDFEGKV
jgi:hypothetical protein